ncbi:hypothetical protein [Ferrimonas sediminum]|nr:hypothetical protein [Ferrimonas sediminum]
MSSPMQERRQQDRRQNGDRRAEPRDADTSTDRRRALGRRQYDKLPTSPR